jgi:hypothetical protein
LTDDGSIVRDGETLAGVLCPLGHVLSRLFLHATELPNVPETALYIAHRDVVPPRAKAWRPGAERAPSYWYADLVVYNPGRLPTGEPFRSIGHWNPPGQLEAFEVIAGEVTLLVAGLDGQAKPYLYEVALGTSSICSLPPGAWHVTYVTSGRAVVFNVYTERGRSHADVGQARESKYRWRKPVDVTLVDGNLTFGANAQLWTASRREPPARWERFGFLGEESIAGWFTRSSPEALAAAELDLWSRWSAATDLIELGGEGERPRHAETRAVRS